MSQRVRFSCSHCGHELKATLEQQGKRAQCTRCGQVMVVPERLQSRAESTETDDATIRFRRRDAVDDGIDLTPMIDVVFQLLIFFMVTAAFGQQKSLELPTPDSTDTVAETATLEEIEQDADFVVVRIERDDTLWVDDVQATSEPDLFAKLRAARQSTGDRRGATRLLVVAHGEARHERVVLALDAGSHVGMDEVRLATVDD